MANSQFAAIADMSVLRVEVDVSELDIARLRKGMPCAISPEAYKDRQVSWPHHVDRSGGELLQGDCAGEGANR